MNGKEIYQLPGGGSVATLAFSLVCHLGFDKIIENLSRIAGVGEYYMI